MRWAGLLFLTLSGCMGMEEFYLEPYQGPEPQTVSCGCQGSPVVSQTGPPPLVQTAASSTPTGPLPPIVQTSGTLPIIRNKGEPALASPSTPPSTNWTPQ